MRNKSTGVRRKTYYVDGLMELQFDLPLPAGAYRKSVRVEFTGGHFTGYGMSAAHFTTDDEVVQKLLEQTRLYKSGRIKSSEL